MTVSSIECVEDLVSMDKSASLPLKKAVNAARFVIRSRTGAAIVRKSYQRKGDVLLEKNAHLLSEIQKEMRKLERDRNQFMNHQNGKLRVSDQNTKSVTSRSSDSTISGSKTARRLSKENELPATKEFLGKVNEQWLRKNVNREEKTPKAHHDNKYNRDAVLYRRDFVHNFAKTPKPAWENNEQNEEVDKNDELETVKSPGKVELRRRKLLFHNLDSFGNEKRLEIWLDEVERLEKRKRKHRRSPAKDVEHEADLIKSDSNKHSELLNTKELEDPENSDCNTSTLKLSRLNQTSVSSSPVVREQSDGKTSSYKSIDDPRFTCLIDSLTPSNNSLKLPNIFHKSNDRAA